MGEHDKPVAWMCPDSNIYSEYSYRLRGVFEPSDTPLYTRPAQWVGLTEEEVQDSYNKDYQAQTRAIEQLLKEKNVDRQERGCVMFYGQCWGCGERWGLGTKSTCKCNETPEDYLRRNLKHTLLMLVRGSGDSRDVKDFVDALDMYIETKLKEKNHG